MTFTYTPSATPSDTTLVRFHTGDTVAGENFLSDEEIAMLLSQNPNYKYAAIGGIKYIIAQLSKPKFKADWLEVDNESARAGYVELLALKRQEFGIPAITGGVQSVTRSDSAISDSDDPTS